MDANKIREEFGYAGKPKQWQVGFDALLKHMPDYEKEANKDKSELNDLVMEPCPFCGSTPVFPEAKDVYGTCYDAGCEDCGIATISLQIIDCFDRPRDHVHDAWDEKEMKYADEYIEVAKREAESLWNERAL